MFRYQLNGKEHEMGLGSVITFSLAEARLRANRCRQLLADGIDPLAERKEKRASALVEATNARTFDECTASYIRAHRPGWKSPKHGEQWKNTLGTYASPVLGALPVRAINMSLVISGRSVIEFRMPPTPPLPVDAIAHPFHSRSARQARF